MDNNEFEKEVMNNNPEVESETSAEPNFVLVNEGEDFTDVNENDYLDIESHQEGRTRTVHENENVAFVKDDNTKREVPYTSLPVKHTAAKGKSMYVTRRAFALTMIIAVLLTAVISTTAATLIMKDGSESTFGGYDNLSTGGSDASLTTAEIAAKNEDAVVEINTTVSSTNMFGQSSTSEGAGSGVIVNKKGYIATNNHVIEDASTITVILHNGDEYKAKLVGTDPDNDIAVLKINASNLTTVTIGDSSKLVVGDDAVVIGNPLGRLGGTVTKGIISALERRLTLDSDTTLTLMQTDAAINPGNSGGGLFNGAGELVGIVVAKSSGTGIEGLGYAIPINNVADIIDELVENGTTPEDAYVGISVADISEDEASYYNLDGAGVYVTKIASDAASKAGFKVGDKIVSINGDTVESASDFTARVREHKVGDTVKVVVSRDGTEKTLKTKLVSESETNNSSSDSDSQNNQNNQNNQYNQNGQYDQNGQQTNPFSQEY